MKTKKKKKYIPEHIRICMMIIRYKKAYMRWQENKLRNELFEYAEKKINEYQVKKSS